MSSTNDCNINSTPSPLTTKPTKALLRVLLDIYGNRTIVSTISEQNRDLESDYVSQNFSFTKLENFRLNRYQLQHLISVGGVKINNEIITLVSFPVPMPHSSLCLIDSNINTEKLTNEHPHEKIKIEIDLNVVDELKQKIRIWAMDKPEGVICTFARTIVKPNKKNQNNSKKKNSVKNNNDEDNDDEVECDGSKPKLHEKRENDITLLDFLEQNTTLLSSVQSEVTLSTNAERRKIKKEKKNLSKKQTQHLNQHDDNDDGNGEKEEEEHEEDNKSVAPLSPLSSPSSPSPSCTLFPVGRLDKDSCGLLLLTNCGSLCERLCHPDFQHEKEYYVEISRRQNVQGAIPERFWQLMREGVTWKSSGESSSSMSHSTAAAASTSAGSTGCCVWVTSQPCQVQPVESLQKSYNKNNFAFNIKLTQGLNRQIRNMVEAAGKQVIAEEGRGNSEDDDAVATKKKSIAEEGYFVTYLRRLRVGPVCLEKVSRGKDEIVTEVTGELKEVLLNWAFSAAE